MFLPAVGVTAEAAGLISGSSAVVGTTRVKCRAAARNVCRPGLRKVNEIDLKIIY